MNIKAFLNSIQHKLAKSKLAVNLAVKLRNQCNSVISYHLADTPNHLKNGESWIMSMVASDCSTFIDVGAYVGDWTECFLTHASNNCLGLVFEPCESAFQQVENKFKNYSNLSLIQSACSDSIGEAIFYDIYPMQSSSLVNQKDNSGVAKTVKISTLDQEIEDRNWDYVDFLKIDCEGYDFNVLRGSVNLLTKQKIGVIQFEYGDYWAMSGNTLLACLRFLNSLEYKVFLLGEDGLLEFNYDLYGDYFRYTNFVAIAQNKMDKYKQLIKGVA